MNGMYLTRYIPRTAGTNDCGERSTRSIAQIDSPKIHTKNIANMGNASSYTSIGGNDELVSIASSASPQSSSASSFGPTHRHGRRLVLVALVVCAVLALVVVKMIGGGTQETGPPIELEAHPLKDGARDCTFNECFASNCDHESAPFTCLFHNGGPHGGW